MVTISLPSIREDFAACGAGGIVGVRGKLESLSEDDAYGNNNASKNILLLLLRIRSAHLEILGFRMSGAY